MTSPRYSAFADQAHRMLCSAETTHEHMTATWAAGPRECPEWGYANRPRVTSIREAVVDAAVARLESGDIRGWDTFAENVATDTYQSIDLAALYGMGLLVRVAWWLLSWLVRSAFEAFVWWCVRYFVRLAIEDIKRKLFGAFAELPPDEAVAAVWATREDDA